MDESLFVLSFLKSVKQIPKLYIDYSVLVTFTFTFMFFIYIFYMFVILFTYVPCLFGYLLNLSQNTIVLLSDTITANWYYITGEIFLYICLQTHYIM